mgnify:CR=1 FL=1
MENGAKRPRRPVKAKANGMWKKVRYAIVILFALVLVQQVYTIYSLHQEKQQLEQQLQELKKENEEKRCSRYILSLFYPLSFIIFVENI